MLKIDQNVVLDYAANVLPKKIQKLPLNELDKAVEKISNFLKVVESIEFCDIKPELHDNVREFLLPYTQIFGWFKYEYNMFLELLNRFEEEYKNFNEKEKN